MEAHRRRVGYATLPRPYRSSASPRFTAYSLYPPAEVYTAANPGRDPSVALSGKSAGTIT